MTIRPFDRERDLDAVRRIWHECGWLTDGGNPLVDPYLDLERIMVAEVNGDAECAVMTTPGHIDHNGVAIPLEHVACVTTSYVGRRKGLAGRVTARTIALDAQDGAAVSILGMFEQGFYNKLGFGNGGYEHFTQYDPRALTLPSWYEYRTPLRFTKDDAEEIHAARCRRMRWHGQCTMPNTAQTRTIMHDDEKAIGLGYRDREDGGISHGVWLRRTNDPELGPYRVSFYLYENVRQLIEVLGLIQSIGDQVYVIRSYEPPMIRLQDFVGQPARKNEITKGGSYEQRTWSVGWWQVRMLDVGRTVGMTTFSSPRPVRFNLVLRDPISEFLDDDLKWRGTAGDYVVELGQSSGAEPGRSDDLPTMHASVGAFTRMWLGVLKPSVLAVTDELDAPAALLEALDDVIRVPEPHPDWDL